MLVLRVLKARKELQVEYTVSNKTICDEADYEPVCLIKVNQDQRGHKVSGVARVHLVQEVNQDHKVLERKETKV